VEPPKVPDSLNDIDVDLFLQRGRVVKKNNFSVYTEKKEDKGPD